MTKQLPVLHRSSELRGLRVRVGECARQDFQGLSADQVTPIVPVREGSMRRDRPLSVWTCR